MKAIIEAIKTQLPGSSVKINHILQELLDEIALVVEYFISEGYIPDKLDNIYEQISNIKEEMSLGYGQLNLLEDTHTEDKAKGTINTNEDCQVDNTIEHTLLENFTHIKPYGFKFLNNELAEAKNWKSLYIKACEMFFKLDKDIFISFENKTNMNGQTRSYFSKEKHEIDFPVKIMGKTYVNTGFGANEYRDILVKILKEYNYDAKEFKVYFKADYNPRHIPQNYISIDDIDKSTLPI